MDYTNEFDKRIGRINADGEAPAGAVTASVHVYEALVTAKAMLVSCGVYEPMASDLIALVKLQLDLQKDIETEMLRVMRSCE